MISKPFLLIAVFIASTVSALQGVESGAALAETGGNGTSVVDLDAVGPKTYCPGGSCGNVCALVSCYAKESECCRDGKNCYKKAIPKILALEKCRSVLNYFNTLFVCANNCPLTVATVESFDYGSCSLRCDKPHGCEGFRHVWYLIAYFKLMWCDDTFCGYSMAALEAGFEQAMQCTDSCYDYPYPCGTYP